MGRRKFRLGKLPKYYGRPKSKKVGRPCRKSSCDTRSTVSPLSDSSGLPSECEPTSSNLSGAGPSSGSISTSDYTSESLVEGNDENIAGPSLSVGQSDASFNALSDDHWMKTLTDGLSLPSDRWIIQIMNSDLCVCKLSCSSSHSLVVLYNVIIHSDFNWSLNVYGRNIDVSQCNILVDIPRELSSDTLQSLVSLLDESNVCIGHPDSHFVRMVEAKKGKLFSRNGDKVVALLDASNTKTIRSSMCEFIVKGEKCSACVLYRNTLRKSYHRWSNQKSPQNRERQLTSSKTNFRFLTTPQKKKRYSRLRARLDASEKKVERLSSRISNLIKENGINLGSLSSDFTGMVQELTKKVHEENPEGSFRQLFWNEQVKALSKSDKRQIRWHPVLIKWCLHLKFISSGAYHALRSSGVITLPSERTLRSYAHWMSAGTGFQKGLDDQLLKEMRIEEDKDRYVVLCWDEIKVKESLVFDKHNCELIGFTDLGDVNNDLNQLEEQCQSTPVPEIASHMLLFMVRGLFKDVKFPYVHYATRALTADTLFPIVWEVVEHLEMAGLNVIAFTSDGASSNRRFYDMHGPNAHKVENPYRKGHHIFFFSDVPHLIKTTRNCWSNSFAHKHSRGLWVTLHMFKVWGVLFGELDTYTQECFGLFTIDLWFGSLVPTPVVTGLINEKHISWEHLVQLYKKKQAMSGLSLLPKLTREHVYLTSYSRMRVNLAAQVLSATVAHALDYYNEDDTTETRRFIRYFDRFFDCFNGRCISEAVLKRKPDLRPYRDPLDSRLTWLKHSFLKYLEEWEDSVAKREKFCAAEKNKMLLSVATRRGIKMTVNAFIEMCEMLFCVPGVKFLLSEKLCQDPVESFFGKQRAAGGRNENPTVQDFCNNTVSLRVQGSAALDPIRGNCRRRPLSYNPLDDVTPLPKQPRRSKRLHK